MASRSTARIATQLASKAHVRRLSMTGPATYPSVLLSDSSPTSSRTDALPTRASASGEQTTALGARSFNTSRSLKAVKDSSTIDFAYLPDLDQAAAATTDRPFSVPLLLSTMYSGIQGRTAPEQELESTLRPLIELVAASGTHISVPSAMSEVHDNNAVEFEGVAAPSADKAAASLQQQQQQGSESGGDIRQLFNDILDDVMGPKRHA